MFVSAMGIYAFVWVSGFFNARVCRCVSLREEEVP